MWKRYENKNVVVYGGPVITVAVDRRFLDGAEVEGDDIVGMLFGPADRRPLSANDGLIEDVTEYWLEDQGLLEKQTRGDCAKQEGQEEKETHQR